MGYNIFIKTPATGRFVRHGSLKATYPTRMAAVAAYNKSVSSKTYKRLQRRGVVYAPTKMRLDVRSVGTKNHRRNPPHRVNDISRFI